MIKYLAALQYCHAAERGIVHRDLKLENIMISDLAAEIEEIDQRDAGKWPSIWWWPMLVIWLRK